MMTKILAAMLGSLMFAAANSSPLIPGVPPPDFALLSLDGNNLRLSEYRTEVVVLNFWAAWCKRCTDALPALNALYQQRHTDGLQVLAVGVDYTHPQTAAFLSGLQVEFPLLIDDPLINVGKTYQLGKLPLTLVIDREGAVRFMHTEFDQETQQQLAAEVDSLLAE